ncbi:MAG TPA: NAD/NADP octopine/nopaline dehydrogenase [Petrimonas sp.]|uniref:NAD/NADP octopine/nopaline dehydrogenase family protein n=1 Tax=Petrimonas sp. TaxID=2023866 RepID=UPI001750E360|nr:NAD/NADP octopine/nopaline dehydrogenase [Petrimonas sp.]
MKTKPTFCICGGGALGHVMAGVISAKGYKVNILTNKPTLWSNLITIKDPNGKVFSGNLNIISSNPDEVIPMSNIILLCLPGYLIDQEIKRIKNFLSPETIIGSIVASTGFFITAISNLGKSFGLFAFQRVPYIARVKDYGHSAFLLGYKNHLNLAFWNLMHQDRYLRLFQIILETPISRLDNILEATLTNSNPILHPTRLYRLFHRWNNTIIYPNELLFYEEWDDETSELLIACDNEFQLVLSALPLNKQSIPPLLDYYESYDKHSLTEKIRSIPAFKGIKVPMQQFEGGYIPDFENRYFTEDIPYGLLIIKFIAQQQSISTPEIDKILEWGQSVTNKLYIKNHLLINSKDIADIACLNANILNEFLEYK